MSKGIKTREAVQKAKDSADSIAGRAKTLSTKTKDTVSEEITPPEFVSPEQYAAEKITESARSGTDAAVIVTEKTVKKTVQKIKKRIQKQKEAEKVSDDTIKQPDKPDNANTELPDEKQNASKTKTEQQNTDVPDKPESKKDGQPQKRQRLSDTDEPIQEKEIKPRERQQAKPKTRDKQSVNTVQSKKQKDNLPESQSGRIKKTAYSNNSTANRIKTVKNSEKRAKKTVQATKNSAEKAVKAANKAEKAARATAKATVRTAKAVAKATAEAVKAIIAATKELVAAIAAGGWVAVVIIIIVCLLAAIGGTCFGIFLSNDTSTGTDMTMSQGISQLTSEYYAGLTSLQNTFTYDELEIQSQSGGTSVNWKDVIAVYAVRTTTSENEAYEVATLDDERLNILRKTMNDMNTAAGAITLKIVPEVKVVTDENGNSVSTVDYVAKRVLTVTLTKLTASNAADVYNFSAEKKELLTELMSGEYDSMWTELLGASGEILISNSSFIGTDIFVWPFTENYGISSAFGTRADPKTGEEKMHVGTDISAPQGTPILAAADGTVVEANYNAGGYGYYVRIKHNDTFATLYGHCSVLLVWQGQTVKQGQVIAQVGSTGYSTGPHCHFEVIQNGVRVNPLSYFNQ